MALTTTNAYGIDWQPVRKAFTEKDSFSPQIRFVFPPEGERVLVYCRMKSSADKKYDSLIGTYQDNHWSYESDLVGKCKKELAWAKLTEPDHTTLYEYRNF